MDSQVSIQNSEMELKFTEIPGWTPGEIAAIVVPIAFCCCIVPTALGIIGCMISRARSKARQKEKHSQNIEMTPPSVLSNSLPPTRVQGSQSSFGKNCTNTT